MLRIVCIVFLLVSLALDRVDSSQCMLPPQWSGKWYLSKNDILSINQTHFINKGQCVESKQDKFVFYENDECYRCIFIMQKHANVLQYRASYCSEQSDFYTNCENLSPESELVTIYRDSAVSEKCPLNGMYIVANAEGAQLSDNEDRSYRSKEFVNTKCVDKNPNKNSMIMECSDQSMLKLQFGKCTNMPSRIWKSYFGCFKRPLWFWKYLFRLMSFTNQNIHFVNFFVNKKTYNFLKVAVQFLFKNTVYSIIFKKFN